jgi:hypothetical protein
MRDDDGRAQTGANRYQPHEMYVATLAGGGAACSALQNREVGIERCF